MQKFLSALVCAIVLTGCASPQPMMGRLGGVTPLPLPGNGVMFAGNGAMSTGNWALGVQGYKISDMDLAVASQYFSMRGRAARLQGLTAEQRESLKTGLPLPNGVDFKRVPKELARSLQVVPEGLTRVLGGNYLVIVNDQDVVLDAKPFYPVFLP